MKSSPLFPARLLAGVAAVLLAACATTHPAATPVSMVDDVDIPEVSEVSDTGSSAMLVEVSGERRRGKSHGVVRGDTLWAISDAYLTDPFMWPKVWDYNGQIMNPDLIYPGDIVRIPVAMLPVEIQELIDAPEIQVGAVGVVETDEGEVRVSDSAGDVGQVDAEEDELTRDFKPQETQMLALGPRPDQTGSPEKLVRAKFKRGAISPFVVEGAGFILPRYRPIGILVGMHEPRQVMGRGDEIFLKLKRHRTAQPGDMLTISRGGDVVVHPVTDEALGKLVRVLGVARVLDTTANGLIHARIERAYETIQPGDELMPYVPPVVGLERKAPDGLIGIILDSRDSMNLLGNGQIVYLDLGAEDGLKPGNEFTVVRRGRKVEVPGMWTSPRLPERESALVQVLSVQERTSTAILVRQKILVEVGDLIYSTPPGGSPFDD
ncbi:MAG: LysM peptidoglycan-binding domain-containing protein [Nitrospirota bacterium]|nr:LysM peptidoglycan-binding domain-containing protein [Nitrospirota bacterium]